MRLESPSPYWKDYELIDSGDFEKLERFGQYVLARPEPKAIWNKTLSEKEWMSSAHVKFITGAGFGQSGKEDSGKWEILKKMPEQWTIGFKAGDSDAARTDGVGLSFRLRLGLTSFKHVGVFPEQAPNWEYIFGEVMRLKSSGTGQPRILNLFAYTGAASLAAKCAGADVTHLDSVKQVVTWARNNMELSGLDNIRWIVEDALKFVKREAKRGNIYDGLILDPPAYGHGPDGERWKLDESLYDLLSHCTRILNRENGFMVLNLYSNGYSALLADSVTRSAFGLRAEDRGSAGKYDLDFGELYLAEKYGRSLPLSVFTRLRLTRK